MLDPSILCRLLRYEPDTGRIFWRARDVGLFADIGMPCTQRQCDGWNSKYAERETGLCRNGAGYRYFALDRGRAAVHRVAIAISTGVWPKDHVDHIDGDPSNNRLANLRPATRHQNLRNQKPQTGTTSRFKGVYFHKRSGKWLAQVQSGDLKKYLGISTQPRKMRPWHMTQRPSAFLASSRAPTLR